MKNPFVSWRFSQFSSSVPGPPGFQGLETGKHQGYAGRLQEEKNMDWITSSYSRAMGNCVQVRGTQVRDGKDPDGPVLTFSGSTWGRFIQEIKQG
jgi:Domain of unknown function (DUF397)